MKNENMEMDKMRHGIVLVVLKIMKNTWNY